MTRWRAKDYFGDIGENEITRQIPWITKARDLYDSLAKSSVLTEASDGVTVDGTHLLTKLLRFTQLCSGYLEDEQSGEVKWYHHSKAQAVVGDLSEILASGHRAVVSYIHTPDGEQLHELIAKTYGATHVALVNGATENAEDTLRLFDIACDEPTPLQVLVIQESVGAEGISLARADHLLLAGWSLDGAKHEQMRKRIWDPSRPANYAYYTMSNSVDAFRRAVVKNKREASLMIREVPWFDLINGKIVAT
jgi:hypothetical protein